VSRKVLVFFIVLMTIATLAIPLANATPPTSVSGTITITNFVPLGLPSFKGKSGNEILTGMMSVTWAGDIGGDTTYEAVMMLHKVLPIEGPDTTINVHETIFFPSVTVLGKSGSLTLQVNANLAAHGRDEFSWTILSGTGELVNLKGQGIYYLVSTPVYNYEGQVHFDP
jgi:hypothetical protein